jgi:hypothetical protein
VTARGKDATDGGKDATPAPENCARCHRPLDDAEGHCGSDLCPYCWGERLNEDRDDYPITYPEGS